MFIRTHTPLAGALMASAALALPGLASAHDGVSVSSVKAHQQRADRALDRSQKLFERSSDRRAQQLFVDSREQLDDAHREADQLTERARNEAERFRAAQALQHVAAEQDGNVEQLAGMLEEADGRAEGQIALALMADIRSRSGAVKALGTLLDKGVSDRGAKYIAQAVGELADDRNDEVRAQAEALAGKKVSSSSKRLVARSVKANLASQTRAAYELAEMIASPEMPASAQQGLRTAYDAVMGEQRSSAAILAAFADRIPAAYRSYVERAEQDARKSYEQLESQRGDWPSGDSDSGSGGGSGSGSGSGANGSGDGSGSGSGANGSGSGSGANGSGDGSGSGTQPVPTTQPEPTTQPAQPAPSTQPAPTTQPSGAV